MISRALTATNASKAIVALILNALIQFSDAFHIYTVTAKQNAALTGVVNAALFVYVLLTYKLSHKRHPGA